MSMTIKETVGRYEGPPRTNNACFLAQKKRIETHIFEDDEAMAVKLCQADKEWDVNEKAKWAEKLEEKVGYHRALNDLRETSAEVRQAAKATIMVRRRALEVQLQKEMDQYNTELASQGKTFHKQRI